ncbi:ABC transporter permease [Evansella cellulosilytica]|uniref:Binding-protein-dependent transport systems inner membrane component n=1 Tax=Evansella cellulosilytica (strain ATCC 21833 / DSM 2522 / FERM P-1141 / JCM 9156 / N-4) TaxID=649639 RepID=E6TZ03_EVAC2|nr:ABC transporter permease [Evansella cellulosilytica]ADU32446.1 binding-protein-dependent transport systems inner membrane component [Evansella cellulosilytica DSM 2522]
MLKIILRRGCEALLTLFCSTLLIFVLIQLSPGDPIKIYLGHQPELAMKNTEAYEERVAELQKELGLDQPVMLQYVSWIKRVLTLDLGNSIHTGRPVSIEIAERLPATILLAIAAITIQVMIGLYFGIISARKAGTATDNIVRIFCVFFASIPVFVVGLLLLYVFAVSFRVFDINSSVSLQRLWLPAITLGLIGSPQLVRLIRANLLSEFGQTYVLSVISRGLDKKRVVRHALRNVLLPIITIAGLSFISLISGAVVIESIFSWPGIGKYALDSILLKDYPVIQGYAFIMVSLVILINLLVDVAYVIIDPRIRNRGKEGVESCA